MIGFLKIFREKELIDSIITAKEGRRPEELKINLVFLSLQTNDPELKGKTFFL